MKALVLAVALVALSAAVDASPPDLASVTESLGGSASSEADLALILLGVLAFILPRPLGRALRRLEQQRRASALSSALPPATQA